MRIAILGAGAIGCYFSARLSAAGADVTLIARGDALQAIARDGIRVEGQVELAVPVAVTTADDAAAVDLLVSCVKAYAVPQLASRIAALVKPGGLWLCAVNGLPWWYGDRPLAMVDPGGGIRLGCPMGQAAACVAYLRSEVVRPGVISFTGGKGLILGMADGSRHALLADARGSFVAAGIATTLTDDLVSAVWNKLFGNVGLNPISAITGLAADRVLADRELKALLVEITGEAMRVAEAEGARVEDSAGERVGAMTQLGAFRTSMLQDVDAGRAIELDAILGAMIEVAGRRGVEVPASRRTYALVRAFAASRGLMPGLGSA